MAKTRRELILEEMGLTPIWRLREENPLGGGEDVAADARAFVDAWRKIKD